MQNFFRFDPITKLDGSARGGGALSAVATTGAPIKFVSTGEKIGDMEPFVPSRFVGRLLGMGDLETLLEKVREAEIKVPEKKAKAILSGKFTLTDMYEWFETMKGMGPFRKLLKMIPGMSYNVPEEKLGIAEDRLERWRVIIQSMTPKEKENPKIFNASKMKFHTREAPVSEFSWKTSARFGDLVKSKYLQFDVRSLDPGKFSFPYHFHRNAEELFVILSGEATLRTPQGFKKIGKGDIVFFVEGPSSAHQVYNHSDSPCVYLDIRTTVGVDICEYPDSDKINILPYLNNHQHLYFSQLQHYHLHKQSHYCHN